MSHTLSSLEPVRSIIKAVAAEMPIGSMIVSFLNDEQTRNIEDTLQKHAEQIDILRDFIKDELYVNRQKYVEDLKSTLQKAKDEANEEKRRLYATYLTACCHPENAENLNKRILLDLVEKIDFTSVQILKELRTHFNGIDAVSHFSKLFKELSKSDILVQLDYLTSYRLIELCSQEEIKQTLARLGRVKLRPFAGRPIAGRPIYYKRTFLGDSLYQFISKGLV